MNAWLRPPRLYVAVAVLVVVAYWYYSKGKGTAGPSAVAQDASGQAPTSNGQSRYRRGKGVRPISTTG